MKRHIFRNDEKIGDFEKGEFAFWAGREKKACFRKNLLFLVIFHSILEENSGFLTKSEISCIGVHDFFNFGVFL